MGISGDTVRNYISLTLLVPALLQLVDESKIGLTPAYQLTHLSPVEQDLLFETIESEQATPSLSQAQRILAIQQYDGHTSMLDITDNIDIDERRQNNGIHFKRHLRSHYNIVLFFRNALQAGENVSELALKQIFRNTRETNYGCILCFVCLYLFKEYYPGNKTDFKTELIDIEKSTGLDIDLLRHNALELIKDNISDGKECYCPNGRSRTFTNSPEKTLPAGITPD